MAAYVDCSKSSAAIRFPIYIVPCQNIWHKLCTAISFKMIWTDMFEMPNSFALSSVITHWSAVTTAQTLATLFHNFLMFLDCHCIHLPAILSFLAQWYQLYMTDISINNTEAYNSYHCWLKNLKFTCCVNRDAVTCTANILLLHGWLHHTNILNLPYLLHKKNIVYPCKLWPPPFNRRNGCLILPHK